MMNEVVLLLGCNIGDRHQNLCEAIKALGKEVGEIVKVSSVYESEPWGFECESSFLNQVVILNTKHSPENTLATCQSIETKLGRERLKDSYEPRTMDIDILFYGSIIMKTKTLAIPHPSLHRRRFTLEPLNEIHSNFKHPVFNKSIKTLLAKCGDKLWVKKFSY
jgi:2-amino-4-hydroxy-6-hydroxymethyldihydropteridine diphosphokinase